MAEVLDWRKKQDVSYAIPLWLRDIQIRGALARKLPEVQTHPTRDEPIAICGYGPSLADTWETVRDFKWVMGCSGSTAFLIERGIVPQWHVAVDPLPGHTVRLIGTPHPDVEYLISSTCHPDVFEHLAAHKAKTTVWHVFDGTDTGTRILPAGSWSFTGGCDVGLRCLVLASYMGFRDLHVFGLDGSYGKDGRRHAAAHPVPMKGGATTEVEGVTYHTAPGMLEASRQTAHELDQLGDKVKTTFYGEGLTQHLVRLRTPAPSPEAIIAVAKRELMSAPYRDINARMHRENALFGAGAARHAPAVSGIAEAIQAKSVLDFGCGKGQLALALPFPIWEYDPAIEGKDESPRPADLVLCFDVLEHVEEDHLDAVLLELRRVTRKLGYFIIHTGPSTKTLPDGRNAHILQRQPDWWVGQLRRAFTVAKGFSRPPLLHVVVVPKGTEVTDGVVSAVAVAKGGAA